MRMHLHVCRHGILLQALRLVGCKLRLQLLVQCLRRARAQEDATAQHSTGASSVTVLGAKDSPRTLALLAPKSCT